MRNVINNDIPWFSALNHTRCHWKIYSKTHFYYFHDISVYLSKMYQNKNVYGTMTPYNANWVLSMQMDWNENSIETVKSQFIWRNYIDDTRLPTKCVVNLAQICRWQDCWRYKIILQNRSGKLHIYSNNNFVPLITKQTFEKNCHLYSDHIPILAEQNTLIKLISILVSHTNHCNACIQPFYSRVCTTCKCPIR